MKPDSGQPLSGKATVDALTNEWGKILAIIMLKYNHLDIILTPEDVEKLGKDGNMEYALVPGPASFPQDIRIRLMKIKDAIEEAKKHKGGFGRS